MKISSLLAAALGCISVLGLAGAAISQNAADVPPLATPAPSSQTPPVFSPGFADMMSLLIQPRHIKLYYAGMQGNWELAAFESRGLNAGLHRIAQTVPRYRESGSVEEALESMMTPRIQAVDDAIAAGDTKKFATAYRDLTTGCNQCHTYMEHPFLVIQVPAVNAKNSLFPGQDFSPTRP